MNSVEHGYDVPWLDGVSNLQREHDYEPLVIEGSIPDDLCGVLYRNGPALFSLGQQKYGHWLDGDGAIRAVRFDRGQVWGAVRIVQSAGLRRERKAGRLLYDNYDIKQSTLLNRLLHKNIKNTSNTNVLVWQQRLLSLVEIAAPTEINIDTLETIGETLLDGVIRGPMSGHPRRVEARRASYNFGLSFGRHNSVDLYEFPDTGPARRLGTVSVGKTGMIHDFIATNRHLIFFLSPLGFNPLEVVFGIKTYSGALKWDATRGTEVMLVPIDAPDRPIRIGSEAFYQWHFGSAFELGTEVIVDFARYPDFGSNAMLGGFVSGKQDLASNSRYERAIIDLSTRRIRYETLFDQPLEFPVVAPAVTGQRQRIAYLATYSPAAQNLGPANQLTCLDVANGMHIELPLGTQQYPSEVVFVARPGRCRETDGYLMTLVYDAHSRRSYVAVLDAAHPEDGPVGKAWFDQPIPFTFHGTWRAG